MSNARQSESESQRPRRRPRRGATSLDGVLAVDKPAKMTSHDVVDRVRRISGEGRVGHAGTLDPMATGLLLVCVGPACRRFATLAGARKSYEARIIFGTATQSDDAEGERIATAAVPEKVGEPSFARELLSRFEGEQEQIPPQVSAIKTDGVAAYRRVRRGETVAVKPRRVTIYALELLGMGVVEAARVAGVAGADESADAGSGAHDARWWDIAAEVSKGTYIRSLARDLGEACGTRAHLGALRRTRIGTVGIELAYTLEALEGAKGISSCFLPASLLEPLRIEVEA
ncbi:MAG: tRNA pseudouridine(55) synthase TruB [Coriobacteriales bacterium]|jgi:tRNA pseudouridine55 synthase|nr:tRNA pseudouridine(55) synthase TruB [Coriobacteriales bacterium]